MCTYLEGPRANGMYYFRRSVPSRLRPILGKREFFFSLRTKDRETAKKLIQAYSPKIQAELDAAEATLAVGSLPVQPKTAAQRRVEDQQREQEDRDDEQSEMHIAADLEREDRIASQEALARSVRIRLTGSTAEMAPEDAVIARMLRDGKEAHEIEREDLLNEIAKLRAKLKARQESVGDSRGAKAAPQAPELPFIPNASQRSSEGSSGHVAITGLFEGYAAQPGIRPGTADQFRAIINHLVAFLGHDNAAAVTPVDLMRWRNHLQTEPKKDGKPRASKTINDSYLAAANVTFAYAVNQMALAINPMADVQKVRADRKVVLREKDFTKEERKTILSAALRPQAGALSVHHLRARRWVPWLCAYTGARVNEITQLRGKDFQEIEGTWVVHITPEAGSIKTDKARFVPIHEHLLAQGLREMVEANGEGPIFYDPGRSRGGMARGQNKRVGMHLAAWVREIGVTDPDIQPNHAWRHTFKTICREAEIDEGAADYMQGHAGRGISRQYGSNSLPALAKQLAKFPRFEID